MSERHIAAVLIVVRKRKEAAPKINSILTEFGDIIVARMGFPYQARRVNIITLIVDGTNDEIGALTGKLGMCKEVTVKSTPAKM
ncbi:MAG: iron-only hydrogenase system regulator [Candidatus Omnitrophica bacterium]|nr:iron-only hydrogenase system regulator [Candidatus Omnitrophota bacterium]